MRLISHDTLDSYSHCCDTSRELEIGSQVLVHVDEGSRGYSHSGCMWVCGVHVECAHTSREVQERGLERELCACVCGTEGEEGREGEE